jgi:hypothetical protein
MGSAGGRFWRFYRLFLVAASLPTALECNWYALGAGKDLGKGSGDLFEALGWLLAYLMLSTYESALFCALEGDSLIFKAQGS